MLMHYFLQARRSIQKALLIFHVTREVSPDFYLFHNSWKEKSGLPYPHNQTFWYITKYQNHHLLESPPINIGYDMKV